MDLRTSNKEPGGSEHSGSTSGNAYHHTVEGCESFCQHTPTLDNQAGRKGQKSDWIVAFANSMDSHHTAFQLPKDELWWLSSIDATLTNSRKIIVVQQSPDERVIACLEGPSRLGLVQTHCSGIHPVTSDGITRDVLSIGNEGPVMQTPKRSQGESW